MRHIGVPVDPARLVAELTRGTLPEAFHATAVERPDAPAVSIDGVSVTHGELDERVARTAGWLEKSAVGRGARVLVRGTASIGFVVAYLSTLRAGATAVLTNPGYTETEMQRLVEASGAVAAFVDGELPAEGLDGPALPPDRAGGDDVAILAYTSGTTGVPKGVPLTHANLLSSIRGVMLAWRWHAEDVLVHALPLFHQHGLGGLHATLLAGSRAVIHPRLDAAALAASIREERATVLFGVPTVYERLLAAPPPHDAFASLRLATSGSAPLPPSLAQRAAELLGQLPLERYGSTEAGLDVSNPYDGPRRVGSVGLPLPGIELDLVDGEVVLRGPQVFAGYDGLPEETQAAFHPGGWFRTGDLGRLDDEGYLSLTGRLKDVIITGGLNVSPREVELVLERLDGVQRAAVAGVPSERWGEEVVAFVVPDTGAALEEASLIAEMRTQLAAYKCPKRVIVTSALPLDGLGKVRRSELAQLLSD
jgi:malonyl-CoA/methylmalonyl-CoA synthetase